MILGTSGEKPINRIKRHQWLMMDPSGKSKGNATITPTFSWPWHMRAGPD